MENNLFALFTFAAGAIAGHKFALYRDRRKERNDAALNLKIAFNNPLSDGSIRFDKKDWLLYLHLIRTSHRHTCEKAMTDYEHLCKQTTQDNLGQVHLANKESVKKAAQKVAELCTLV